MELIFIIQVLEDHVEMYSILTKHLEAHESKTNEWKSITVHHVNQQCDIEKLSPTDL